MQTREPRKRVNWIFVVILIVTIPLLIFIITLMNTVPTGEQNPNTPPSESRIEDSNTNRNNPDSLEQE